MKKKISQIINLKGKRPIVSLTSYSKSISNLISKYCDLILVGDSVGTALYGMKNTKEITLEMIIQHAKSAKLGSKSSLCVVDMPYKTYRNRKEAKINALKIIKETKCDAVKIESNGKNFKIINHLVKSGISVMGHIGFTPQYKNKFKPQGVSEKEKIKLTNEALNIEKSGAFAIVLECIKTSLAKNISKKLKIPTIGIGSSKHCDGQILVTDDILGLSGFYPKFVKRYAKLDKIIEKSVEKYRNEVVQRIFPKNKNSY